MAEEQRPESAGEMSFTEAEREQRLAKLERLVEHGQQRYPSREPSGEIQLVASLEGFVDLPVVGRPLVPPPARAEAA